jgi:alpha-mannosidase
MNNHWHTNFPLSQEGKIRFRYRIFPHNSEYNAAESNRFGLDQAQPLVATPVNEDFRTNTPMLSQTNSNVFVTILRKETNPSATTLRLRSVSDKDEIVKLDWMERKPLSVMLQDEREVVVNKEVNDEIIVPANGFVTLEVRW